MDAGDVSIYYWLSGPIVEHGIDEAMLSDNGKQRELFIIGIWHGAPIWLLLCLWKLLPERRESQTRPAAFSLTWVGNQTRRALS